MPKCTKCGKDIPDAAAFCPECGTPKPAGQPATPPPTTQPTTPPPTPRAQPVAPPPPPKPPRPKDVSPFEGIFDMLFSKTGVILTIAIGSLLAFIGSIIVRLSDFLDGGALINMIGFGGIGFFLLCSGIWNKKIDKFARFGMVIIGGIILLSAFAAGGTSISNSLQSLQNMWGF